MKRNTKAWNAMRQRIEDMASGALGGSIIGSSYSQEWEDVAATLGAEALGQFMQAVNDTVLEGDSDQLFLRAVECTTLESITDRVMQELERRKRVARRKETAK